MKKTKIIITIILIVLLLTAGLFFIMKPKIDNKINLKKQEELIEAIENGDEAIEIELGEVNSEPDYYSIDFNEELKAMITPLPSENPLAAQLSTGFRGV